MNRFVPVPLPNHEHEELKRCAQSSLFDWLDKDMQWFAAASCKRWRKPKFLDAVIQLYLSIKNFFGLSLRWVMGFVESLLNLSGAGLSA